MAYGGVVSAFTTLRKPKKKKNKRNAHKSLHKKCWKRALGTQDGLGTLGR